MKPTLINRFAALPLSASSLSSAVPARQGKIARFASISSLVLLLAGTQSAHAALLAHYGFNNVATADNHDCHIH